MIYILIALFLILSIISFFVPKDKITKEILYLFLGLVLIFIAGFRGEGVDRDYDNYVQYFQDANFGLVEPSFVLISKALKVFTSIPIALFLVFAFLGVSLKFKAIKQLSELPFLCLAIYASYFFILHEMTQIRAGVASGILLLCIKPIYNRDWKRFLLFAFLAVSFHYSALIIFPFWFLGHKPRKTLLILAIPLAYLVYFSHVNLIAFLPIPGIKEKLDVYKQLQELGDAQWNSINVFNLLFLSRIIIFYFIIWKYELITAANKFAPILLKIYCFSLVFFLIFATMPVIAFRINELCGIVEIILVPLLYYAFKPTWFAKTIVLFIGLNLMFIILFYEKLITF
jgi:hypothetical protein